MNEPSDTRNKRSGRWTSTYDRNALFKLVADVARHTDPDDPQLVSQRKWDDSRLAAGHPSAPSARQITTRLKLAWDEVKRIALDPDRSIESTAGGLSREHATERKRTPREIHYGLHLVARTLDRRSFSAHEYDRTRDELIAEERRRLGDQSILSRLVPTAHQITTSLDEGKTWNDALESVGLEPYEQQVARTALSLEEAFDLYVDLFQFRPTRSDLDWLRQQFGVSISKLTVGTPWTEIEARCVKARADRGAETPAAQMPKPQRKDATIPDDMLARLPQRTVKGKNTYEVCVRALAEYLESLAADQRPSLHHYQRVAPTNGWPALTGISRHAPWSAMLNAARHLRRTGELLPVESLTSQSSTSGKGQLSEGGVEAASSFRSSGTTSSSGAKSGSSRKQSRKAA